MILVVDCGSSKTPFIHQLVDEFMDVQTIGIFDLHQQNLSDYSGVVISGAPILVTEVDTSRYIEATKPLIETDLPLLGICFGHQIIGIHHGAYASRMREDRDWQEIEQMEESPLFHRLPQLMVMMEDHCETISIPQHFKLIASSDACINEAMQHTTKSIFGVQFHPEVSGNHGRILIENFIKICENPNYPQLNV